MLLQGYLPNQNRYQLPQTPSDKITILKETPNNSQLILTISKLIVNISSVDGYFNAANIR